MFVTPVPKSIGSTSEGSEEIGGEPDYLDPSFQDSPRPDALCQWVHVSRELELAFSWPTSGTEVDEALADERWRYPGAIQVADYGCGIEGWLVVSGSEFGAIWIADPNGSFECSLFPIGRGGWERMAAHPDKRLDFLAWYDDWLDDALVTLDYMRQQA
jgi:hypothetical protein